MDKLKMRSENLVDENIDFIAQKFPNAIVEAKDEKGNLSKMIDFEVLKQELSKEIVESDKERYQMTWPGKKQAILTANAPVSMTLRPCKEDSVDFDNTKNIYIEGDNLDVLKVLRETYLGKVKMIYIDPPYNTGNDFIYNDDFATDTDDYLERSNQIDDQGNRMSVNSESNGRFHSDWLNMMYPRLKVAKDLLSDDGFIFISIDDNELFNLKKICDEIFSENNFVNNISIKMSELSGVKMKHLNKFAKLKESGLIYAKNIYKLVLLIEKKEKDKETLSNYLKYYSSIIENINDDCEKWNILTLKEYFEKNNINVNNIQLNEWKINNANRIVYRTNSKTIDKYVEQHPDAPNIQKIINEDGNEIVKWNNKEMLFLNKYIKEYIGDIWMDISTINLNKETDSITFENGQKPLSLLRRVINTCNDPNTIVLDFFSGSATTAHAVMQLNAEDGGNRKFIMVQLPELTDEKSEAYKAGYKNICEIGKERIRRAGKKIVEELKGWDKKNNIDSKGKVEINNVVVSKSVTFKNEDNEMQRDEINLYNEKDYYKFNPDKLDIGFRVFKLDSSNMKDTYYEPSQYTTSLLDQLEENIKPDRTPQDLLFQVMLDLGLMLDSKIEEKVINNKKVFIVGEYNEVISPDLICCFDSNVDNDTVKEIANLKPRYAVFRDSSMAKDSVATNFDQIFETYSPSTTRKVL